MTFKHGGPTRIRTSDSPVMSRRLCQLSYRPIYGRAGCARQGKNWRRVIRLRGKPGRLPVCRTLESGFCYSPEHFSFETHDWLHVCKAGGLCCQEPDLALPGLSVIPNPPDRRLFLRHRARGAYLRQVHTKMSRLFRPVGRRRYRLLFLCLKSTPEG